MIPYNVLIYMLLSEDVIYASNVFETYVIVIIGKLYCFLFNLEKSKFVLLFVNSFVILFLLQISVYVMCICLIMRSWCKVDLPRSFMTLGRLPGLYK